MSCRRWALARTTAKLYAVSRNWDRANTTEPTRTDLAAIAQPGPQKWPASIFEGKDKGR